MQTRQLNKTVNLEGRWKMRAEIEKTWVRLLTVFIAFIPFSNGFGIEEFESEQAPVLTVFRRMATKTILI
jgi:hypothetical protein